MGFCLNTISFLQFHFISHQAMNYDRLIQCQGNGIAYIKHLELRILELDAQLSCFPESQRRPCKVCQNPSHYRNDVGSSQELYGDYPHDQSRSPENTIQIISYEPPNQGDPPVITNSPTPTVARIREWERLLSFASSVSNLPKSTGWKNWISNGEPDRKKVVLNLLFGLASPDAGDFLLSTAPLASPTASILLKYSKCIRPTENTDTTISKNRPFTCFQELIFCSLCAVALEVTSKEKVFPVMRSVFGSDAQEKTLRVRIRGAKWVNRAMYLLSISTWGLRSWDIIYIGMNEPTPTSITELTGGGYVCQPSAKSTFLTTSMTIRLNLMTW
jgi:hypothetical protein